MVLWLDASRENAARRTASIPEIAGDSTLQTWHDASGIKRDFSQDDASRQPRLINIEIESSAAGHKESHWVVRFDGENDVLASIAPRPATRDCTLFVVAAPRSNLGGYRGLFSSSETDRRDFESGWNVDLGSAATSALTILNVEGKSFRGAKNLLKASASFGSLHVFEARVDGATKRVSLTVDGLPSGERPCTGEGLSLDVLTLGARHSANRPGGDRIQGFFHGDIAELLLFDRALTADESASVTKSLQDKHAALTQTLANDIGRDATGLEVELLTLVTAPPAVQMLVPGFEVREVPVQLKNLNNLRYREDGKLIALGYDGDIWILGDADGDGVPDHPTRFFDSQGRLRGPIGLAVIPKGHALLPAENPNARGVIVPSKGKVSAILDLDGDDVAEVERVIASGWKEIAPNVDTIGVAIHPLDGAIYFGLGTAAYNNAYQLDKEGKAEFDLHSERGTIQRIRPDLSGRDTVCTGVRFTIGMAFDDRNELFVTDQEGATWLPNGNPFDELLHIREGRHYGFPPRHPRHLPEVFDEPSLFDYGPQHQSTCGLIFNVPSDQTGKHLGPPQWRGDALVCGESRGKLYRTSLTRSADGSYLATNQIIACLSMLTVDSCLTPRGDLLVACHSGGPDWGSGPSGAGKLFLIRYHDGPQPTKIWTPHSQELHVAFDRPLEAQQLEQLLAKTKITFGRYVAAGDRFESIRPGYAATQRQLSEPRFRLPVYSASVSPDRRTLIFATAPQTSQFTYSITLPGRRLATPDFGTASIEQVPEIDLAYSPTGVETKWTTEVDAAEMQPHWRPDLNLDLQESASPADAEAVAVQGQLRQRGTLTLATQIATDGLFTPSLQPGTTLDYAPADDQWIVERRLVFRGHTPFTLTANAEGTRHESAPREGVHEVNLLVKKPDPGVFPVSLSVATGGPAFQLTATWSTTTANGTQHSGPLARHRFHLPWTTAKPQDLRSLAPREIPELAGANWGRGRRLFFGDEAGCGKCHAVQGTGGTIGPDLTNLIHRDYVSVLRDITQPSFAINPDYITHAAALKDGRVLTGVLRTEGDLLHIGDREGRLTSLPKGEIESLRASSVSLMPDKLFDKLGPERTRDLLAYLLRSPPQMLVPEKMTPPRPRPRAVVVGVLAGSERLTELRPLRLLLVAGKKDHGPGEHDYPAWLATWNELLSAANNTTVDTAAEWPSSAQLESADVVVVYQKGLWNTERQQAIDAFLQRGGGLVYIHWAIEGAADAEQFAERIGLASNASHTQYRHGPLELVFDRTRSHPISRNFDRIHFVDESYWKLRGNPNGINVLASATEASEPRPLCWTVERGTGRVFVSIPGHYSWTFDDPLFRTLLLRGIAWSAHESVDRFNELVPLGARIAD